MIKKENTMKIHTKFIIAVSFLASSGCSYFTRPMEQPVIEEKLNQSFFSDAKVGTLSLTPDRRVVLVNFTNDRFCAEAPTEVGADLSRVLKLAAEASKGGEYKAGLEAIAATSSSNSVLNKRTQGIQLFLANSYFICQMYMNKAIDELQLMKLQLATLNAVAPLIEKEITLMYKYTKPVDSKKYNNNGNNTGNSIKYVPLDINPILEDIEIKKETPNE
jgi:hypothetical protein